jgi:hypothetical protein
MIPLSGCRRTFTLFLKAMPTKKKIFEIDLKEKMYRVATSRVHSRRNKNKFLPEHFK